MKVLFSFVCFVDGLTSVSFCNWTKTVEVGSATKCISENLLLFYFLDNLLEQTNHHQRNTSEIHQRNTLLEEQLSQKSTCRGGKGGRTRALVPKKNIESPPSCLDLISSNRYCRLIECTHVTRPQWDSSSAAQ